MPDARRAPVGGAGAKGPSPIEGRASELTARLREIAESATCPEDALEPMLRAVLSSTGAVAGALCLYDVRDQMLRLAAEVGLSDEGCRRLRTVKRSDTASWGMPLHSMLNGRAYLIEHAARNRFVPALVENATDVETVVCLPLQDRDATPLASLILITFKPRTLDERDLNAIGAPLLEMARLIETTRQRAVRRQTGPPAAAPSPRISPRAAEETEGAAERVDAEARTGDPLADLARLRAQLGEARADAARERRAREELETRFVSGASAGRQEVQRAQETAHAAERARAAAVAETARLRAELDRVRLEAASAAAPPVEVDARLTQLQAESIQLRARLAEAEAGAAHEQRAREELEARLAGGASAEQQELRKAFTAAREAESARAAAVAETVHLRAELDRMRLEEALVAVEPQERDQRIGPMLAEIDRLRARLAEAEAGAAHEHRAREELEARRAQSVAEGHEEIRRVLETARRVDEDRAAALAEVTCLRSELERARLEATYAPAHSDEADARVVGLVSEVDRLRVRLAEAEAGAAHEHRAREELESRFAADGTAGQQELRRALETARRAEEAQAASAAEVARLSLELQRAHLTAAGAPDRTGETEARATEMVAEIDRLHTRIAEAEAGAAHQHRAREELEARLAEIAVTGQQELRNALEAARRMEESRAAAVARVAGLETDLEKALSEAARVTALTGESEARAGESEARAAELVAEIERLHARIAEMQAAAEHPAGGADHDHLAADLEGAIAAKAHLEAALQQALEDASASKRTLGEALHRTAAQLAEREAELEALREQRAGDVESFTARLAKLATEADRLREEHAAISVERDRLAADLEGAAAGKAHLEKAFQEVIETGRIREHEALGKAQSLATQLATRETEIQELREQNAAQVVALNARLEALATEADGLREVRVNVSAERDRLAADLEGATASRAHLEEALQHTIEDTRAYERELQTTRAQIWHVAARLVESEAGSSALREERAAEVSSLAARLEAVVSEADHLRETSARISSERDHLAAELEGTHAARAHLEESLKGALEEARARTEEAAAELREARSQAWEEARRLTEREAETLRATREEHRIEIAALNARLETLFAEADGLRETAATAGSERDRLAAALEGAATAKVHLERVLKETLDDAHARNTEATRDLQETRSQAWSAAARLAEAEVALEALHDEHATELASLNTRVEMLSADAEQLRTAEAAIRVERDRLAAEVAGAQAAHARLEETLQQTLQESRTREQTLAASLAERDRELESLRGGQAALTPPQRATAHADLKPPPAERAPSRVSAPPTPVAPGVSPGPTAPGVSPGGLKLEKRLVAVLDGEAAWGNISLNQYEVIVLPPDRDVVKRLEEARPGRVVANLAVPGVLQALLSVREAKLPLRFWGCVAEPAADRVLPLGVIEPAARPLAPDAVIAVLSSQFTAATRVVTVGADVDALLSLRQALSRNGMSVSMAWDARQAPELVDMVRPGIVVVDLGMGGDACAFVVRLAGSSPTPAVVLIEAMGDTAQMFAASLGDRAVGPHVTSLKSFLAALVSRGDGKQPRAA